jgi:hypothetical protein
MKCLGFGRHSYSLCAQRCVYMKPMPCVFSNGEGILDGVTWILFDLPTLHTPPVCAAELAAKTAAASVIPDKPVRPPPPAATATAPARPPAPGSKASDSSISVESNEGVRGQEADRDSFLIGSHLGSAPTDNLISDHLRSVAIESSHYLYLNRDSPLAPISRVSH